MVGISSLNPLLIQNRTLHFVPSDHCAGPAITVKRPDKPPSGVGGARLRRGTLAFGHHEDRSPTHGYADTREAAMAAFPKSWRRE
jgi:hypothetical protein